MLNCPTCDTSFLPKYGNRKYCCNDCKKRHKYECSNCGKQTIRMKHNREHTFCCMQCSSLFKGTSVSNKCRVCEKDFIVKASQLKKGWGKCCSKKCQNEYQVVRIECVCPRCGVSFKTRPNKADSRKFCSAECSFVDKEIKITKEELYEEYINKRKCTRTIARKYNTSKTSIIRALKRHDIKIRSAEEARMPDGYSKPEKDVVFDRYWLKWMSYSEIAKEFDVDAATVAVWVKEYNIRPRKNNETRLGKSFIEPKEKELRDLYLVKQLTTVEIGKILGCGGGTVSRRLKEFGIQVRPNIFNGANFITCKDGHVVRSNYERAFDNYLHYNGLEHEYEPRLPVDKRYASDFLVGDVYVEIWGVVNNSKYEERRIKKTKLYHDNGLKLLEIYPNDFKDIQLKINELKRLIS